MYMHFYFVISFNKIDNLDIDFGLNHGLWGSSNEKDTSIGRSLLPAA